MRSKFKLILALSVMNINWLWGADPSSSIEARIKSMASWSSGGGNAVVCFDDNAIPREIRRKDANGNIIDGSLLDKYIPHVTSVEILDLYEARLRKGFNKKDSKKLIEPHADEDIRDYAKRIIARTQDYLPSLYQELMKTYNELDPREATELPYGMEPVNDYNMIGRINSEYCVIATLVLQADVESKKKTYLYYDARLWDWAQISKEKIQTPHSQWSKDVAYLHEIVYRAARIRGQTDSRNTRELVKLLITQEITSEQLREDAEALGFSVTPSLYLVNLNNYKLQKSSRYDGVGRVFHEIHKDLLAYLACHDFENQFRQFTVETGAEIDRLSQQMVKTAFPDKSCSEFSECRDVLDKLKEYYSSFFTSDEKKYQLVNQIREKLWEMRTNLFEKLDSKKELYVINLAEDLYIKNLKQILFKADFLNQSEKELISDAIVEKIRKNEVYSANYIDTSYFPRPDRWFYVNLSAQLEIHDTVGYEIHVSGASRFCSKPNFRYFSSGYYFATDDIFNNVRTDFIIPVIE